MTLAQQIKDKVLQFEEGTIVTLADFDIPTEQQRTLNVTLNRLVANGTLRRLSKGRFYKPRQSVFGMLPPATIEVVKDFLVKNGKTVGYITGTSVFAEMGLTTQISSQIVVGTNKYRRAVKRGDFLVSFLLQPNPIRVEEIKLYRILDAIRLVREIPATTPDECVTILMEIIRLLPEADRQQLAQLAQAYTPYVRALLGAMLEQTGLSTYDLKQKLNGVTTYKLPISELALPTKSKWNIV